MTSDEKLAVLDRVLDEYEAQKGIPNVFPIEVENEVKRIFGWKPGDIRGLSATDCGEAASTLFMFAFQLRMIAPRINEYFGKSFEERKLKAITDDDAARKLDQIRLNAQLRIDRLSFYSNKLENLAKSLADLRYDKRGTN